jgi:hypothetical protein
MDILHFEGREVPPYGEYAAPQTLVVGNTYFAVHYLDKRLEIPEMRAFVFIGRNLQEGDSAVLYFQDAESYVSGVRYESATGDGDAEFHTVDEDTPFVYEFARALDRLLYCSLTRSGN